MKVILSIILSFLMTYTYGQIQTVDDTKEIEIGKVENLGSVSVKLTKVNNTVYFTYSDSRYKKINNLKTFSFEDTNNALNDFYNNVVKSLESGEKITMKIPNGIIITLPHKSFGMKSIQIGHSDSAGITGHTQFLTKKQVDKLFGKQ